MNDDCRCKEQFFFSEDCSSIFYCTGDDDPFPDTDGCRLQCEAGQIAVLDVATRQWECRTKEADNVCPGKFNTDCPGDDSKVHCSCRGEVWMIDGCSVAFECLRDEDDEGNNHVIIRRCPDGQSFDVDFYRPTEFTCAGGVGNKCPGNFHYGCEGGDMGGGHPILCHREKNPLGNCQCDEQFFMSQDCTEGFWCHYDPRPPRRRWLPQDVSRGHGGPP